MLSVTNMQKDIIVKKSKIEGLGVFALRNFKKGEIILKWDISHKLKFKEVKNHPEKRYIAKLNKKYILIQPPERYVNHSCNANTYTDNFWDIAKKNIKKGEEITGNYSQTEIPGFKMKCICKSKNCKNFIEVK